MDFEASLMQDERVKHSKRNATSTWSGFSHQGKLGILIALREIERLGSITDDDLQKWCLEYEVSEDITIWNNNIVVSKHQVKANNSSGHLYSSYSAAIDKFECTDTPEDARFLHTTRKVTDFKDNTNKVKTYLYPDGKEYCRLADDQCFSFCVDAIGSVRTGISKEFSKQICHALMGLVAKQIAASHDSMDGTGTHIPAKIDFLTISRMVHTSSIDEIIQEADEARLKNTLVKSWDGLRESCLEAGVEIKEDNVLRTNDVVASINKMDYTELIDFLKFIHPNLDFSRNRNISESGFQDVFIKVISECIPEFDIESGVYSIKDRRYIPTTIADVNTPIKAYVVAKAIINNHDADSKRWLFERSSIINLNIEGDLMTLSKINREAYKPVRGHEHIMAYTDSSLVKTDDAIQEINAGIEV